MIQQYRHLSCVCVIIFCATTFAHAQSLEERAANVSGESFVRAFIGNCAQNAGDFERIISASEAMAFKNLPDKFAPLVAPRESGVEFKGYFVDQGEGAPYFFGVSRKNIEAESFVSCTIANPYIDTAEVVAALESFLQLRQPSHDEIDMGQRYRSWSTDHWVQGSSILLTDAEPMGYSSATLSMIAPVMNFHSQDAYEKALEAPESIERLLFDQFNCSEKPSAIVAFIELQRHGYIDSAERIGIDGISCFRMKGGIEINGLVFETICGQEANARTVEDFPDFLWNAPGCCPVQQLSLGTARKENEVIEWYQKTYGTRPDNVWIRSINTTLGDETELKCVKF